ncbi:MAG: LemA family protein [Eubacteriales bacterium]|nr:LemA family protein [Eubacteriales bacterium]
MKKVVIGIVALLVIVVILFVSGYNGLVKAQSQAEEQEANIMAQLQRRIDLIPNLVDAVNQFTTHETEVFAAVTQARQDMMSAKSMPEMAAANDEMSAALSRLVAVAEAYPELKSDAVYTSLMDELAGTENRIAVARQDYNAAVQSYNLATRKFPNVLIANMFGFKQMSYFEATEAAQTTVPSVS